MNNVSWHMKRHYLQVILKRAFLKLGRKPKNFMVNICRLHGKHICRLFELLMSDCKYMESIRLEFMNTEKVDSRIIS